MTSDSPIPPTLRPGESPQLHRMGEYVFQDLCAELLGLEPGIGTSDVYGERGSHQDGIDIRAYLESGDGIDVGQCKCYSNFPPAHIIKASDEFFAHWDSRWKDEPLKIRRFILFVACDMHKRDRQDELERQRQRFATYNISYEWWPVPKIRSRLRPHRGMVMTYFKDERWVQEICGPLSPSMPVQTEPVANISSTAGAGVAAVLSLLGEVGVALSGDIDQLITDAQTAWREGNADNARSLLLRYRGNSARWSLVPPEAKARILRLAASLEADLTGHIEEAHKVADEARALAPTADDTLLRAVLAYKRDGPDAALSLLAEREDTDALTFRCALLLELGRLDECRGILDSTLFHSDVHAETLRLRALVHLTESDVAQARLAIDKALEVEPRWLGNRITDAMVGYYSALSPAALPRHRSPWPEPVDWAFVKRDAESQRSLRHALQVCQECATVLPNGTDEQRIVRTWLLACLANDPDRQDDAAQYCRSILAADPTDVPAVMWAVSRGYSVDLPVSRQALQGRLDSGNGQPTDVIGLVVCLLTIGKARQAIRTLWATKDLFDENGQEVLWTSWYAQAQVRQGGYKRALAAVAASPAAVELRYTKTIALRAQAMQTGDWTSLLRHLDTSYAETGDSAFLFDHYVVLVQRSEWDEASVRAQRVIEACQTEASLRFALLATYNHYDYELCLRLLDEYRGLLDYRGPSMSLRRLRVNCQVALSLLPEAIASAQDLVRDHPTTENVLLLLNAYVAKGDLDSFAVEARRLVGRSDLPATQAIQTAMVCRWRNISVARDLWRQAVQQGISDDGVADALQIASHLGLAAESGSLATRLQALGGSGQGHVQILQTLDELRAVIQEMQRRGEAISELYTAGRIPVHLAVASLHRQLAELYHRVLADNEMAGQPLRSPILFVRHGNRASLEATSGGEPSRLCVDITALLLAAHLDILPAVEHAFGTLHLAPSVPAALVTMMNGLAAAQPTDLTAPRLIVELAENGSVQVVPEELRREPMDGTEPVGELRRQHVLRRALDAKGFVVDLQPFSSSSDPPPLPPLEAPQTHVTNCRAVADALHRTGPLDKDDYDRILAALHAEGQADVVTASPPQDMSLFCTGVVVDVLARTGLLRPACGRFKVSIWQADVDQARHKIKRHQVSSDDLAWLDGLLERVRRGIDAKTYMLLPVSDRDDNQEGQNDSPDLRVLREMLAFEGHPGDVLWIDDRFMNGYAQRDGGVPIVGINEVLTTLRSRGTLSPAQYYAVVSRLRAANTRYIPIDDEELLHHLHAATEIAHGRLVETTDLSILRRYMAACLARSEILQRPPMPSDPAAAMGEMAFVLAANHAVSEALIRIWDDEGTTEVRQAWAEWVLDSLYLDLAAMRAAVWHSPERADAYMSAVSLAGLLPQRIPNAWTLEKDSDHARQYSAWLTERILRPRFLVEPYLADAVANVVKESLVSVTDQAAPEKAESVVKAVLQRIYNQQPQPIQDKLAEDVAFMARLGFELRPTVGVGDLQFEHEAFWQAAVEAVNGRIGHVQPLGREDSMALHVRKTDDDDPVIYLEGPDLLHNMPLADAELPLVLESVAERETFLQRHRSWFDGNAHDINDAIASIATMEDPIARVETAATWRRESASVYYTMLVERLKGPAHVSAGDLLPPNIDRLVRYLRLDPQAGTGESLQSALVAAANAVLGDEGIDAAIERFAGFPVAVPEPIVSAFAALSEPERREVIERICKAGSSPLLAMHSLHLLHRSGADASAMIAALCSADGRAEVHAFLVVLDWVNQRWSWRQTGAHLSPHLRLGLIWIHAHSLFRAYRTIGTDVVSIEHLFGSPAPGATYELFSSMRTYRGDCAHPHHVDTTRFLVTGLFYAFGGSTTGPLGDALTSLFADIEAESGEKPRYPSLVTDMTQATNVLGSFLGSVLADGLAHWLGQAEDVALTQSAQHRLVEQAIKTLGEEPRNIPAWRIIHLILRDLPPYVEVADPLRAVLSTVDYTELAQEDIDTAISALLVAAEQVNSDGDDRLRQHVQIHLLHCAEIFAHRRRTEGSSQHLDGLDAKVILLLALEICRGAPTLYEQATVFASLFWEIVARWRELGPAIYATTLQLREELSLADGQALTSLLLKLRAVV